MCGYSTYRTYHKARAPGFPMGNTVIYPPQPGHSCLVLGSNQAKKPFFLSTSVFHTVLHVAHASVTFDPRGSCSASSRDLTGCPAAFLVPAARPVDATAKIQATAIPSAHFRLLKGFIVTFFPFPFVRHPVSEGILFLRIAYGRMRITSDLTN